MAEIWFYHLQVQRLEEVLPTLLERSLGRGWRVGLQSGREDALPALNDLLWTYRDESFLPHGLADEPYAQQQPILLSADDSNGNGAQVCFLVHDAPLCDPEPYERMILMFDDRDQAAVQNARIHWKALKDTPHSITYWQQDDAGRWQKKA